ncbi:hypothetical protein Golob_017198, partial [Gossypium lobatum]|nr:hypothetical protein [Gossypium lobatum]
IQRTYFPSRAVDDSSVNHNPAALRLTTFRRFRCNHLLRFTSNNFDSRKHYGESRGTRRVLAWPCNDSHCRARILQAEVTKKLMNLLEDINDWM